VGGLALGHVALYSSNYLLVEVFREDVHVLMIAPGSIIILSAVCEPDQE
jgi:hypothetical protein